MKNLIKKEFLLALHPTIFIFLFFAVLIFVPNYPYEAIFFFSGLSTFFYFLQTRENKDIAFSLELPIKKKHLPIAKIITVCIFQSILLIYTFILSIIKQSIIASNMLINFAGISANVALVANGAIILGVFNLIFFPLVFKNPNKVGLPFVISAIIVFLIIGIFIVLRFTTSLYGEILNGVNNINFTEKIIYLLISLLIYILFSIMSAIISSKQFSKIDL